MNRGGSRIRNRSQGRNQFEADSGYDYQFQQNQRGQLTPRFDSQGLEINQQQRRQGGIQQKMRNQRNQRGQLTPRPGQRSQLQQARGPRQQQQQQYYNQDAYEQDYSYGSQNAAYGRTPGVAQNQQRRGNVQRRRPGLQNAYRTGNNVTRTGNQQRRQPQRISQQSKGIAKARGENGLPERAGGVRTQGRTLGARLGGTNIPGQNSQRQQYNSQQQLGRQSQNNQYQQQYQRVDYQERQGRGRSNSQNWQNNQVPARARSQSQGRLQTQQQTQQQQPPRANGIGFVDMKVQLPSEEQLKYLQVKAELTRLGDAPRAYQEKIVSAEGMQVDTITNNSHGMTLDGRFHQIEGAPRQNRGPGQRGRNAANAKKMLQQPRQAGTRRYYNR